MGMKVAYTSQKKEYLDDAGLQELWDKIKEYVSTHSSADVKSISKAEIKGTNLFLTFSDDTTIDLGKVVGADGTNGNDGKDGTNGTKGTDGRGISSIIKTSTNGLVDTYTISYTDSTTSTFAITNGADGSGTAGKSIASITKTSTDGLVDTYTITFTDNSTFPINVTNGSNGINGINGSNGSGGITYTPVIGQVATLDAGSNATASVNINGTNAEFSFGIPKGADGSSGSGGSGSANVYSNTEETQIGTWIDGKVLYRKVFHFDASPGTSYLSLDFTPAFVTKCELIAYNSTQTFTGNTINAGMLSGTTVSALKSSVQDNLLNSQIFSWCDVTLHRIGIYRGSVAFPDFQTYVVLEYTK